MSLICSFPLHLFYLLVFLYQFFSVKTKQSITRKSLNDLKSKKPHKNYLTFHSSMQQKFWGIDQRAPGRA